VISTISFIGFVVSGLVFLLASVYRVDSEPRPESHQKIGNIAVWSMLFFLLLELFLS
jgi:hypothetical protein